jgi:hypothetical protein
MEKKASIQSSKEKTHQSVLLSRLATRNKIQDTMDSSEYRLITGCDDGHIFFWNIPFDYVHDAKSHQFLNDKKI